VVILLQGAAFNWHGIPHSQTRNACCLPRTHTPAPCAYQKHSVLLEAMCRKSSKLDEGEGKSAGTQMSLLMHVRKVCLDVLPQGCCEGSQVMNPKAALPDSLLHHGLRSQGRGINQH